MFLLSGLIPHVDVDLIYVFQYSLLVDVRVHIDELVTHMLRAIDDECDSMGDVFHGFRVLMWFARQVMVAWAVLHLVVACLL